MISRFLSLFPLLGALLLAACGPASRTDALLNDVESYINEAPDSARTVLQSVDASSLRTKRLRARHALLRTMAQNKCYDDLTVPGLLEPAAWYEHHGSPDERLKYWMYRGRIQLAEGRNNEAAVSFSRAESFVDKAKDRHTVGLLYLSLQGVYEEAFNRNKEQEYSEKAIELFKRIEDPLTRPSLGMLARVYHGQQKWAQADSVYQEALPYFEVVPALAPDYLSDYAKMKVLQPEKDPVGAIALLDRYRELTGSFRVQEAGTYAYALELLGRRKAADAFIPALRNQSGDEAYTAQIWLTRIDVARKNFESAFWGQAENYRKETELIQQVLGDSVAQALREDADRQSAETKAGLRLAVILAGGAFFALLSLVLLLLLRKSKIETERNRLVDLREQMQNELDRIQEENAEKEQLISGQEDRIREMEEHVARERERFTRDRVSRLRQLGELRSTFWWRERGGMREVDAIQRIKKEFSYVFQTDNDGAALFQHLDEELNGAVSRLRDALRIGGKPKEVLFLCCCILDLEPEMIAEIMDTTKANVYEKRSRLRARVRVLDEPLLTVLIAKNAIV